MELTRRIAQAGQIMGIELLGHPIVAETDVTASRHQGVFRRAARTF